MKTPTATWSISLDVECPNCSHYFDILDSDRDFWSRDIDPCETRTVHSRDVEIQCPNCKVNFLADLEY